MTGPCQQGYYKPSDFIEAVNVLTFWVTVDFSTKNVLSVVAVFYGAVDTEVTESDVSWL